MPMADPQGNGSAGGPALCRPARQPGGALPVDTVAPGAGTLRIGFLAPGPSTPTARTRRTATTALCAAAACPHPCGGQPGAPGASSSRPRADVPLPGEPHFERRSTSLQSLLPVARGAHRLAAGFGDAFTSFEWGQSQLRLDVRMDGRHLDREPMVAGRALPAPHEQHGARFPHVCRNGPAPFHLSEDGSPVDLGRNRSLITSMNDRRLRRARRELRAPVASASSSAPPART